MRSERVLMGYAHHAWMKIGTCSPGGAAGSRFYCRSGIPAASIRIFGVVPPPAPCLAGSFVGESWEVFVDPERHPRRWRATALQGASRSTKYAAWMREAPWSAAVLCRLRGALRITSAFPSHLKPSFKSASPTRGMEKRRLYKWMSSANGATHTSLAQRPRFSMQRGLGLKARPISSLTAWHGLSALIRFFAFPGALPQAGMERTFGPQ